MEAKTKRWSAACLLAGWSFLLVRWVVFKAIPIIHVGHMRFKFGGQHTGPSNLRLFATIWPMLTGRGNRLMDVVNLLGNILPFLPIGFLAPCVFQRMTWQKSLVLAIVVGVFMETSELVLRVGVFDVDDILLNACGVMFGFSVFAMLHRYLRHRSISS